MGLPKLNLGYLFFYKSWYSGRGNDSFWSQELLVLPVETGSDPSPADFEHNCYIHPDYRFCSKSLEFLPPWDKILMEILALHSCREGAVEPTALSCPVQALRVPGGREGDERSSLCSSHCTSQQS